MSELIGKELGPYRILEQIGVGGMAAVYKAYHATMDRFVAVKVLPEHLSKDAGFRKRFEQEAKVIAKLEHAHILPVYDYGEDKERVYLVMRYLEAGTLKQRLAEQPPNLPEAGRILRQVGGALAHAHRMGVVHRDVKPSNVLMDAQGNCFLTDFGLAKMMEASARLTATGVGLGTPAYMSPEQGQGEKVDNRSDVYSLGVMLYEMVTGRVPFEAETPMAVVLKHMTAPLPLPREVKADVPPAVERVLLKALAKNPEDRFQSAEEMIEAFDAAARLAGEEAQIVQLPARRDQAEKPAKALPTRAMTALRQTLGGRWGRVALWAAGGVVLLAALALILSRIPLRVNISGGRLEVVRVEEATPTPEAVAAATPTEMAVVRATATGTLAVRPTGMATPTALVAAPASPPLTFPLRIRFTSTSDWADVTLFTGGDIVNTRTVETGGEPSKAEMRDRKIELDQPIKPAEAGHSVYIVQDVTIGGLTEDQEITFTVQKGCIGVTTVEVFNLVTGAPLLVERLANDTCGMKAFTVQAGLLTTANPPPAPTPEPLHLQPARPEGGKIVIGCPDVTPPQLCVFDMVSGDIATNPVTQITTDLDFEALSDWRWSPDGEQIVISAGSNQHDDHNIYLINADGSGLRQLTHSDVQDQGAEWSPDGQWIAFYRDGDLWRMRPDGSGEQALFAPDEGFVYAAWSPDSQRLALLYFQTETESVWVIRADGGDPHQVYAFEGKQLAGGGCVWTPDGQQILCWYDEKGREGIEQTVLINADGSGVGGTIDSVPYWWHANYWPRWGAKVAPTPAPLSDQAGQAAALFQQASDYIARQEWREALAAISQAIELDPTNPHYYLTRALIYETGLGKKDEALADANTAIELAPTLYEAWQTRGSAYMHFGECDAALADVNQAIALDPGRFSGYVDRANVLRCLGRVEEAIADYGRGIAIDPTSAPAYWTRGMLYEGLGDLDAALADYNQAITLLPDNAWNSGDFYSSRAGVYRALGQHEQALADCEAILALIPDDPRGFYCRGMSEAALGQIEPARADFEQAVSLLPLKAWDAWVTEAAQAELDKLGP
jgi:tetratricopeptide (TPR) repeat protein/predicted Ser/Thr protein kinase